MVTLSWARKTGWLSLVLALLGFGCFASARGYQLYPGLRADSGAVAKLTGYVQWVDGEDVSKHGRSFELMPGCHTVTTPKSWGQVSESGGVVANTGPLTYAIRMQAGYSYRVEVKFAASAGSPQSVRISAKELDPAGKVTGIFSPAPRDPTCQEDHRGGKDTILAAPGTVGG